MNCVKRLAVGAVLTALAATVGVVPVTAVPLEDYGATFVCRYRTIDGNTFPAMGDLRRIVVTPPIMFADENGQTLGWRLIIRRIRVDYDTDTYKVTAWKSKIRTAVAYRGQAAAFTKIVYRPPDLSETGP